MISTSKGVYSFIATVMDIHFQHPVLGLLAALCLFIYWLSFMAGIIMLAVFWVKKNRKFKRIGLRLLLVALISALLFTVCLVI